MVEAAALWGGGDAGTPDTGRGGQPPGIFCAPRGPGSRWPTSTHGGWASGLAPTAQLPLARSLCEVCFPFSTAEINLRLDAAIYASSLIAAADAAVNAAGGGGGGGGSGGGGT